MPMNRRRVLIGALAMAAAVPFAASAQRPGRTYRVGILAPTVAGPSDGPSRLVAAFRDAGYVAGQNLVVERRYADGKLDRLPALARELAKLEPDAIVVVGPNAARAVRDATSTIPVVFYGNIDPVATGLVQSLARPGGNLTGVLIAKISSPGMGCLGYPLWFGVTVALAVAGGAKLVRVHDVAAIHDVVVVTEAVLGA